MLKTAPVVRCSSKSIELQLSAYSAKCLDGVDVIQVGDECNAVG